jgi:hypothetical protein
MNKCFKRLNAVADATCVSLLSPSFFLDESVASICCLSYRIEENEVGMWQAWGEGRDVYRVLAGKPEGKST